MRAPRPLSFTFLPAILAAAPLAGAEHTPALLGPNHPRVFFFRGCEGPPSVPRTTYEAWSADFGRLMGIMGKCLDEEVLGREARNPEFFSRFKREHPEQTVLLHFNGNSRDPRHHTEKYFPGHWTYRDATAIAADVPAEAGESTIRVADASGFQINAGRYQTSNDDIALFGLTADGRHDWGHCEQVQLLAADRKAGTLRVKRGCYGTKPLSFKAGQARAAAHAVEGPWGRNNNLLWYYNFSTHCPKDPDGRTCADRLVDDLAAWFGDGGKLDAFDGLEFDVMFNETHGDTDGDGKSDNGVIAGINNYGIGVVEFARQLRKRMGEDFIIQGDGALGPGGRRSQRAFGILNGIESEGFPNLNDWDFEDWSGGINRHAFWQANGRKPAFSYINHKWNQPVPGRPGDQEFPEVPFSRHRLCFAGAQFTDAMICYSFPPPGPRRGKLGIWDEFVCGVDSKLGWLGRPEGPAVHIAAQSPDALHASGAALAKRVSGRVTAKASGEGVSIAPLDPNAESVEFDIRDIPAAGDDFLVLATLSARPRKAYPIEMARFAECALSGGITDLMGRAPSATGMALRGKEESEINRASGARVQPQLPVAIGETTRAAFAIHPPFQNGRGYVFWTRDADVPRDSELRFHLGMGEKAPARSDGVWFKVLVAEITAGKPGAFETVFEKTTKEHAWIPCSVPLGKFAGKRVRFKFLADCGPADNATTDHGYWADVQIAKSGLRPMEITPAVTRMTWVNNKPFASAFYFRGVRSPSVDLAFSIEGPEPITLHTATAHAAPDAMCRVFEHGIVLANPSLKPVTFDLAALSPGRNYRRIQATTAQDIQANNGQPVGSSLTLAERDALFLLRLP